MPAKRFLRLPLAFAAVVTTVGVANANDMGQPGGPRVLPPTTYMNPVDPYVDQQQRWWNGLRPHQHIIRSLTIPLFEYDPYPPPPDTRRKYRIKQPTGTASVRG